MPEQPSGFPPAAVDALSKGNKIEAIKIVREAWRIGLKESKDAVEEHLRNNPDLSIEFERAGVSVSSSGTQILMVLALIAAAVAIYFYFNAQS